MSRKCSLIILRFYVFLRKCLSANSVSYKCTLLSIFGPCLCKNLANPPFTRICRDLRALSRKFLWQKFCYSESFRFCWLCPGIENIKIIAHLNSINSLSLFKLQYRCHTILQYIKSSQELRMLSRSLSDCKSLLLNVMILVSQFVSNLCHLVTNSLNHSQWL